MQNVVDKSSNMSENLCGHIHGSLPPTMLDPATAGPNQCCYPQHEPQQPHHFVPGAVANDPNHYKPASWDSNVHITPGLSTGGDRQLHIPQDRRHSINASNIPQTATISDQYYRYDQRWHDTFRRIHGIHPSEPSFTLHTESGLHSPQYISTNPLIFFSESSLQYTNLDLNHTLKYEVDIDKLSEEYARSDMKRVYGPSPEYSPSSMSNSSTEPVSPPKRAHPYPPPIFPQPGYQNHPNSSVTSSFDELIKTSFPSETPDHVQKRRELSAVMTSFWKTLDITEPSEDCLLQFMFRDVTKGKWHCQFWKNGRPCKASCKKKDHAKGHIRAHINHRPFKCTSPCPITHGDCDKRYPAAEPLSKHRKGRAMCDDCGLFMLTGNISRHRDGSCPAKFAQQEVDESSSSAASATA